MPIQPNDRYQQDPELLWPAFGAAGRFPAQPPRRGHRESGLSWSDLNKLPAGPSSRHNLNTR